MRRADVQDELAVVVELKAIDAAVHIARPHTRKRRRVRPPPCRITAEEDVTPSRQRIDTVDFGIRARADEPHPHGAADREEHRLRRRHEQGHAATAREELHARIGLADVRLEAEGQRVQRRAHRGGNRGRCQGKDYREDREDDRAPGLRPDGRLLRADGHPWALAPASSKGGGYCHNPTADRKGSPARAPAIAAVMPRSVERYALGAFTSSAASAAWGARCAVPMASGSSSPSRFTDISKRSCIRASLAFRLRVKQQNSSCSPLGSLK